MPTISGSVGKGGANRDDDVRAVQGLLNQNIGKLVPLMPVIVTGKCDTQTILMIEEFQRRVLQLAIPDGRVDPEGHTISALMDAAGSAAATEPMLDGNALPGPVVKVFKEILKAAGLSRATVTSVSRTPADQARVMYENCVSKGAGFNKKLYASAGDKVVDVYAANKDKPCAAVIQLMLDKILELGPGKISKHISDTHYTFDVAPGSIPAAKHEAFLAAVKAHKAVSKVIPPPTDPAFHIEIPKDSPHL